MFTCTILKGCNGSGKSTIPITLKQWYDSVEIPVTLQAGKACITFIPVLGLAVLGKYNDKTGGCDSYHKPRILELLSVVFPNTVLFPHILYEGSMFADTKIPYVEFMAGMSRVVARKTLSLSLYLPVEEAIRRVEKRNGGVKMKNNAKKLRDKHRAVPPQTAWLKQNAKKYNINVLEYENKGTREDLVHFYLREVLGYDIQSK